MAPPETKTSGRFYFALPRLIARVRGGSAERSEANWLEANLVGAATHAVVYAFFARRLLTGLALWQQVALVVPVALLVWMFWLLLFAFNRLLMRIGRSIGVMRNLPDARAQGVLIGIVTTMFAFDLLAAGSWLAIPAVVWLLAVSLNLSAALLLAVTNADR